MCMSFFLLWAALFMIHLNCFNVALVRYLFTKNRRDVGLGRQIHEIYFNALQDIGIVDVTIKEITREII